MSHARTVLARVPFVLALTALATFLVSSSSLARLAPTPPPMVWIAGGTLVAFLPALLMRGTPLPATLAALMPALLVASYEQTHLDWLRLLKDFGITDPHAPDVPRLLVEITALAIAWALHAHDHALRLRLRARERGMDVREARAAYRISLTAGARRGALGLGAALLVALGATLGGALGLDALLLSRSALLAPLLAAALVAVAVVALSRRTSA